MHNVVMHSYGFERPRLRRSSVTQSREKTRGLMVRKVVVTRFLALENGVELGYSHRGSFNECPFCKMLTEWSCAFGKCPFRGGGRLGGNTVPLN